MKSFNYYPITILNEDEILVLKMGKLYIHNVETDLYSELKSFKLSVFKRFAFCCKIVVRLLRLTRIIGVKCGEDVVILAYDGFIYRLNFRKDEFSEMCNVANGKRPLNMIYVSGNKSFSEGVYYGEYFSNPDFGICNICYLDDKGCRRVVYEFEKGKINHVHSLLEDIENDCIWIFTGDFGHAAGIWMAKNNFKSVEPVLVGAQEWRSCVAICDKKYKGVVYATDTPLQINSLRLLCVEANKWVSKFLYELDGSVIYSFETEKSLFFSTTVESNGIYKNRLDMLTNRVKGKGIKDYYSYLYRFDKETYDLKIIYKQKKDVLPFVLFQFGTMMFPTGKWKRDIIPLYHVATKKYDSNTVLLINK